MSKLTSQHIARLYAEKSDALAPASVRYIHAVLRSALEQAVSWRLLAVNPAQAVKPPRKPRNDIQPLNAAEARALLEVAADDPLLALYVTALHTGMRLGELLGMTWDAIDWSRGIIEVRGTLQRKGPKEYRLEAPKTERSRRTVPMIDQLAEALRQHRSREVERLLALGYGRDDMRWVFTDRWGEPIYWGHVTDRLLRPLCRQAGIREIRFHDLRHTAASMLLSHGVPVHIVADILGHTSATTTLEVYAHLMPGDKEAAMRTLGAALGAVG
jgi:integrase